MSAMKSRVLKFLKVEEAESGRVFFLLIISFMLGMFIATFTVASQTIFLNTFSESEDLPKALLISGIFGIIFTGLYNFLQGRIPFRTLGFLSLFVTLLLSAGFEFGQGYFSNSETLQFYGFTLILPFTFITSLVFWGSFARMFNLRQSKRVIGIVDLGTTVAQVLSFFIIPFLLSAGVSTQSLYTVSVFSLVGFLLFFFFMSNRYLTGSAIKDVASEEEHKKLNIFVFLGNKYILSMALFIIVSLTALRFVDYSFFNVTINQFSGNKEYLPYFLSLFEATIVIFGFAFGTWGTDWLSQNYGIKVSLLVSPVIIILFTSLSLAAGFFLGYDPSIRGSSVFIFFITVAMSKLFINSLREAIDAPIFKFYYVPIEKSIKLDAQTKMEGVVTALASTIAGGVIVLINSSKAFSLLSITLFTLPLLIIWYWVTTRMYAGYRETLQGSLGKNKAKLEKNIIQEFKLESILEREVKSVAQEKVIYGLKLMEKLEPALFETSIIELVDSKLESVRRFALTKVHELNLVKNENEIKGLAAQAAIDAEDSDLLSISVDNLLKLSKSIKQTDRVLAAKLLRKLSNPRTLFVLLELLRDQDSKVRTAALQTARKIKKRETWPVLIELLSSPLYGHHAAAALKEAGEQALQTLEGAFHKSGQTELVMLKIIQIMGHIGGTRGLQLLWKKIDYPNKKIVRQILFCLRFIKYQAKGRESSQIKELLDVEIGKTLWNLAALKELPSDTEHFNFLREALNEEIRENYDYIGLLLSLLYDPQSVQLAQENIETGTTDGIAYGLELLDLFVDQDLKPKLIPILDDTSVSEKMEQLQIYFPREYYTSIQTLNYILNRDFNSSNRWTKACAIHASAYMNDFRVSRGLISQLFNKDKLLQETSAWVIYNKDRSIYKTVSERLPHKDKKFLDSSIENNQLLDGLDDGFFLVIEIVLFMKQLPQFKGIKGTLLTELADKVIPLNLKAKDKMVVNTQSENNPILIMALGEVNIMNGKELIATLKKGDVFGDLFQEEVTPNFTEVVANEKSIIFKVNLIDFYFVLANHHQLAQGLIHNITGKKEATANF
jgi:ATP:ADP antiporter, AAA family